MEQLSFTKYFALSNLCSLDRPDSLLFPDAEYVLSTFLRPFYQTKQAVMTISDEQFAKWYTDINQNMKKYEGKTLKMKGQVFRMSTFAKNEIVPVRYAMVCCAADLQPCGILCRSDETSQFKENDWVWVTGKIVKVKPCQYVM